MKHTFLGLALGVLAFNVSTTPAYADFLDSLDSAMNKIENTITRTENSVDRASGTAERLNSKIPDSETDKTEDNISAEEAEILRRAQEIEERKILEEAEAIKRRRGR